MKKSLSLLVIMAAVGLLFNGQLASADNNNYYNNPNNSYNSNNNSLQAITRISNPNEPYRQEVLNVIQSQIENVYKQYNVNMYDLVKINRLNKYQKNSFIHATELYRTALFHAIQTLEFYKEDLVLMNLDNYDPGEGVRRITEIRMKTNSEYNNLDIQTNDYLRTCTFIMPPLSFQRYAQEFKRNYVLHDLYLRNFTGMLKIDQIDPKYKH